MTANKAEANTVLPSSNSELPTLIEAFKNKSFTDRELVALSRALTIGLGQCGNVDESQQQRYVCSDANNNNVLLRLDEQTHEKFDNLYYENLLLPNNGGLLHSDRVLVDRPDLKVLVVQYASNKNNNLFFQDFANAMKKMSEMGVLTGANGEIRRNCSRVN
jgi:peroxidase